MKNVASDDRTKRGYTGHEHLDDAGLIHMNGRVYDPDTGRMLSPDPFINQPANPQSYNRYSYVLNNPLSYTDPSGYEIEEITINGTRIHIHPLDLKTGLGAAFLFSNSSSSYPVVSSSFFVLVPETVYTPVTGSHIPRKTTELVPRPNPFASRIPGTGVKVAGDGKGSKALEHANGSKNKYPSIGEVNSQTFRTREEAARAALSLAGLLTLTGKVEYAGWIIKIDTLDGLRYGFTNPVTMSLPTLSHPGSPMPIDAVATYHTHPPILGIETGWERFSNDDLVLSFPGYLGTPSGHILINTPGTGRNGEDIGLTWY